MSKYQLIDRMYKKWIFIAIYFMSAVFSCIDLTYARERRAFLVEGSSTGNLIFYRLFWAFIIGMNSLIIIRKIIRGEVRYNKVVKIFIAGIFLWLTWGFLIYASGLSVFGVYGDIFKIARNFIKIFLVVNIITIYDNKLAFIRVYLICLGSLLIFMFIKYFNGFTFLNALLNIFSRTGRDRFDYGFGHPNTVGQYCFFYLSIMAIYKAVFEEESKKSIHTDIFYTYFLICTPAVIIMLLASGSRSSLTGVMLFWLVYWVQTIYHKISVQVKVMFVVFMIFSLIVGIYLINWGKFYEQAGRGLNYVMYLPLLTDKNAWMTGFGFLSHGDFINAAHVNLRFLDSYYLMVLLQSGIVGFILCFGTIYYVAFCFFQHNANMTKSQMLVGGFFAALLWRALFEAVLLNAPTEIWVLIIIALNEKIRVIPQNLAIHKSRLKPVEN